MINHCPDESGDVRPPTQVHPNFLGRLSRTPDLIVRGTLGNMTIEAVTADPTDGSAEETATRRSTPRG